MINVRELRIGNWYDHNGQYRQATPSTIEETWHDERPWCEPIPLTEEILLRCGFEEGQTGYYFKDDIIISVEGQVYFGENEVHIAEIYHLHQLQNLVYALTGEELEINL